MALNEKIEQLWTPPWYWAPYVYWTGVKDWWQEVSGKKHAQVFSEGLKEVKKNKHRIFRRISTAILIFLLYLFIAKWVIAPAIMSGAVNPSSSELLWSVALLSLCSVTIVLAVICLKLARHTNSVYTRGLTVLRAQRGLLHEKGKQTFKVKS